MKQLFCSTILIFLLFNVTGCASTRIPVSPGVIPQARSVTPEEEQYGHTILQSLSEQYPLEYNDPALERIQKIVDRLTAAAQADNQPWHVYLFRADHVVNAAATRGNHVFVWTGLVRMVKNDDELATIVAHEIAHVLAGHTDPDPNEELKKILISVGAIAAGVAVTMATRSPEFAADIGNLTTDLTQELGKALFLSPYSRGLEIEADTIGLMLMAEAKYNPEAAVDFWSRAQSTPGLHSGLGFLSTHPPSEERVANARRMMPIALARKRGEYNDKSQSAPFPGANPLSSLPPPTHAVIGSLNGADSFELSPAEQEALRKDAPNKETLNKSEQESGERESQAEKHEWTIVTPNTHIYREPSFMSERVEKLKYGDRVEVTGVENGWVTVLSPQKGYVQSGEARPLAQPLP